MAEGKHLPDENNGKSYASRNQRVSKDDLYMVLALFMEGFPVGPEQGEDGKYRKVGAALVLPDDKIYAIDCSRKGVHGVARLLMAHPDVLKDCKIFVSRKPCSLCTKLLVQSKVKEVFYLPFEPEYYACDLADFEKENLRVEEIFRVSAISQKIFVPVAGIEVVNTQKNRIAIRSNDRDIESGLIEKYLKDTKNQLIEKYWKEEWMKNATQVLPWLSFDENMRTAVKTDFDYTMEWVATTTLIESKICKFQRTGQNEDERVTTFDPENRPLEYKQAVHLIILAKFLAKRTDDPKTGVGAVIIDKDKNIVGLGWNGFPTKAIYGQFPRASDSDKSTADKKYPYIIHAEQNALLMRNIKDIAGGTLFVTKTPCHECTPLLEMQGITTVVLGTTMDKDDRQKGLKYSTFSDKVEKGKITCYEKKSVTEEEQEQETLPEQEQQEENETQDQIIPDDNTSP